MKNDINRIQDGETTKYNSSLDILKRINTLWQEANTSRRLPPIEGTNLWVETLNCLESELSPFLNDAEEKEVASVRVSPMQPNLDRKFLSAALIFRRNDCEKYEKVLRRLFHSKGMGLRADESLGDVILGGA